MKSTSLTTPPPDGIDAPFHDSVVILSVKPISQSPPVVLFWNSTVFSDPPINAANITKVGQEARLDTGVSWQLEGTAASLPDGPYTVAVRPHHVTPLAATSNDVAMEGTVLVTELSGSESSAHFQMGDYGWVSLAHGVHPYEIGESHRFYMDTRQAYYFDPDGRHVA